MGREAENRETENREQNRERVALLELFVQLVMRLQSHLQKTESRSQRTEQSSAIRTVCAVGNATSVASKQRAEQERYH